jgi:hypothetical protein
MPDHCGPFTPPPLAVQPAAPTEDHVSVKLSPLVTLVGLAVKEAVNGEIVRFACVDADGDAGSMLVQLIPKV